MKIEILKLTRGFTLRIDTGDKVEHVAVRDLPGLYQELGDYLTPLDPAPMPMHGDKPFSVGDCVHSIEYGDGKVTGIDQSANMSIKVTFNAYDTVRYFYPDGSFTVNSSGASSFDLKHGDKP